MLGVDGISDFDALHTVSIRSSSTPSICWQAMVTGCGARPLNMGKANLARLPKNNWTRN